MLHKVTWHWPDFTPAEVLSPNGLQMLEKQNTLLFSPLMLTCLQQFRQQLQQPILINHAGLKLRGYRSCAENAGTGKPFSMHLLGIAADCSVAGLSTAELAEKAKKSGLFTGIGIYKTFVHLDIRCITDDRIREWRNV